MSLIKIQIVCVCNCTCVLAMYNECGKIIEIIGQMEQHNLQ